MSSLKESIKRSLAIQESAQASSLHEDAFHKMLISKGFKREGSVKGRDGWNVGHHYTHPSGMAVKLTTNAPGQASAMIKHGVKLGRDTSASMQWSGGWSSSGSYNHPDELAKHIDSRSAETANDKKDYRFKPKS